MKRVNLFCGHYGSGKTNISINFALKLKNSGYKTAIADIDIVNPYFRTKDSEKMLESKGIKVISLPFANSNVDLPSLPAEVYSLVQDKSINAVFDVGGDDRGAYALGRYAPYIIEENNYDMFFVVNFARPLTKNAGEALDVLREIEKACSIPFTAVVNNTNLGAETTRELIEKYKHCADELCEMAELPLAFTCVEESICLANEFPLKLQKRII